jgi:heat shock protein HslJ
LLRNLSLLLLLAAAACNSKQTPAPIKKEQAPAIQPLTLAGQWRVVALGNKPVDSKQTPIFMTANGDRMFSNSQCVWWHWAYQIDGGGFSAEPTPRWNKIENGDMIPPPMCARGLSAQEKRFAKAIESADKITAVSQMEIVLTGREDAVKLQRRPNIEGRWTVKSLSVRPLATGDYPLHVDIGNHQITANSQCVSLFWTYQLNGATIRTRPAKLDEPICERSRTATERTIEAFLGGIDSWRVLADHSLQFQAGKKTITLQPQL